MGKSPSIPSAPPPPDPSAVAQANAEMYRKNIDTYIEKQPAMAELENKLRMQYMPQQRELERQLSALDQSASVQSQLQLEQKYGGQRTLEALRRQYEYSPEAYALNKGLGQQMTTQFARLYGQSPYGAVQPEVAFAPKGVPADYLSKIGSNVSNPNMNA
jgi:hypothetical protein